MQRASKNGDISCFGVAFSRQQVRDDFRYLRLCESSVVIIACFIHIHDIEFQVQKVYVQHIIPQHAHHIAAAVARGACILVCGAAQQMPKAVFSAFVDAVAIGSNMSAEDAEKVLQGMMAAHYLLDQTCVQHRAAGMERSQRYILDTWT
jgi:sulfite reductase alpha subunit-like flavoprotein